jgi:hypothetical protein
MGHELPQLQQTPTRALCLAVSRAAARYDATELGARSAIMAAVIVLLFDNLDQQPNSETDSVQQNPGNESDKSAA